MKLSLDEFNRIIRVFENCKKENSHASCRQCSFWEGFCNFRHFMAAGLSEEDRKKVYGE